MSRERSEEKNGEREGKGKSEKGLYVATFSRFLHSVSPRLFAILSSRFGVSGKKPMTLDGIGRVYGITRERVRQIISGLLNDVRAKRYSAPLEEVSKKMEWTLKTHHGILSKEAFFRELSGNDEREWGALRFFLAILSERFSIVESDALEVSVAAVSFSLREWEEVNTAAKNVFARLGHSLSEEEFLKQLSREKFSRAFSRKEFLDYLAVSKQVRRSAFGRWGLPSWGDIRPRGTRERAYLVANSKGVPLHFREIATLIDEYGLQKKGKKTHPQTVHNELIKDKRFVLVGRGTYALVEWGYTRGTVKEVISDIFRERNHESLSRKEIVDAVLKVRDVKESTILINLNTFFKRVGRDAYAVREAVRK